MIVATAGHIDHGKTLLVKALTGTDTDRLPEEKARGISIDLGFAYWPLPGGGLIGFVDVPGHERFVRNMLAGVCGIDFALLVVAADDGVMPQTVEHLQILDLLGIRQGVAVITKIDRVAPERVAEVTAEVKKLVAGTVLQGIATYPVSAITGAGMEPLRQALIAAAKQRAARERRGHHFRFAIDRAFIIAGSGTVVTGTIFSGQVKTGDRFVVSPRGVPVRIRRLQIRGQTAEQAAAGERCALNLTGNDLDTVARGEWVLDEALHAPTRRLEVEFTLLPTERAALKNWTSVHLHIATDDIPARVAIVRDGSIAPGTTATMQLVLDRPTATVNGDRFVLRDVSGRRTLGGGRVLDPYAPASRRASPERLAAIAALRNADPKEAFRKLLEIPGETLELERFGRTYNLSPAQVESLAKSADAAILGKDQRVAIPRREAAALRDKALAALADFHRQKPQAQGMELETLRRGVAPHLSEDAFHSLLRDLVAAQKLVVSGSIARLPTHDATSNPEDAKMWEAVLPALGNAGFSPPLATQLAQQLGLRDKVLKDFLHRKRKTGDLYLVAEERFYPKATLATLAATANAVAAASPGGAFTAAQYRDAIGTGRTLAIQILECLDTLGITQRSGDLRRMRKDYTAILGAAQPAPKPAKPPGPR